jgi:hypothetical protein
MSSHVPHNRLKSTGLHQSSPGRPSRPMSPCWAGHLGTRLRCWPRPKRWQPRLRYATDTTNQDNTKAMCCCISCLPGDRLRCCQGPGNASKGQGEFCTNNVTMCWPTPKIWQPKSMCAMHTAHYKHTNAVCGTLHACLASSRLRCWPKAQEMAAQVKVSKHHKQQTNEENTGQSNGTCQRVEGVS